MFSVKKILFVLVVCPILWGACVKAKVYRSEKLAKENAEARETVLLRELADRKKEAARLIKDVADYNRTIGNQEEQIRLLRIEVASKSQQFGESAGKLSQAKAQLEEVLAQKEETLAQRDALLSKVYSAQSACRDSILSLFSPLSDLYSSWASSGVILEMKESTIEMTLPDASLFETNGTMVSNAGRALLLPLSQYLASHPDLDLDVIAYTDNTIPKDKTIKDTWDWSLVRATNIARMLIREFNVNANQLTPVGKGEFYPVASNEDPEGRAKNRRTVIVFRPALPIVPLANE